MPTTWQPLRQDHNPIYRLTSRELDVLRLVAAGKPNKQIATGLAISERTARTHVSRILRKLRLSSRTQAALWAVREGLVEVGHDRATASGVAPQQERGLRILQNDVPTR